MGQTTPMFDPQSVLGPLGWVGTVALVITLIYLLANGRIRALAKLTVLDSIRRMEFQAILLLAVVLLGGIGYLIFVPDVKDSPLWAMLIERLDTSAVTTPGVTPDATRDFQEKFPALIQSGMLFFAELFTLAMVFALGLLLIPGDIEQGFLLTILPKPATRGEYLWGRGLGVLATVGTAWLVMSLEIFFVFALHDPSVFADFGEFLRPEWKILWGAVLILFKWASFLAFLLLFTLKMPPVAGGIVALLIFGAGHVSGNLRDLGSDVSIDPFIRAVSWATFVAVPHYERAWSATILDPDTNQFLTYTDAAGFLGWAWLYTMVAGGWLWLIFRKRDL